MTHSEMIFGSINAVVVGLAIWAVKTMWDKVQKTCTAVATHEEKLDAHGAKLSELHLDSRTAHNRIMFVSGKLNLLRLTVERENDTTVDNADWDITRRNGS